jgi:hypothetical protein
MRLFVVSRSVVVVSPSSLGKPQSASVVSSNSVAVALVHLDGALSGVAAPGSRRKCCGVAG